MKRNTLNFLIDVLTFLVFFAMFWIGLLIHYVLPPSGGHVSAAIRWFAGIGYERQGRQLAKSGAVGLAASH